MKSNDNKEKEKGKNTARTARWAEDVEDRILLERHTRLVSTRAGRLLLVTLGWLSLVLGILGVILPVLPTTPFVLLAGALFARGSQRFYLWLHKNRFFGPILFHFRENRCIPARIKVLALTLLFLTIGSSAAFVVPLVSLKILLVLIGLGVAGWILSYANCP